MHTLASPNICSLTLYRYPFHLRPKNKQVFHYLRMAADLVHDLELDQESNPEIILSNSTPTETQLEGLRTYLGFHYLSST